MTATVVSRQSWEGSQDQDGHREYRITWLVLCTSVSDGPYVAGRASGLPAIGSSWVYGNDSDAYALCWPTIKVTPVHTKEKGFYWTVENLFSTKPLNRCQTASITNPLAEPDRISGSFVNYTKRTTKDIDGNPILNSCHQAVPVDIDANRATVTIEQNVASLGLDVFSGMINTVNDASLWGLSAGCVKLRNVPWERRLYGTCTYYYTRRLEFDIDFDGFKKQDVLDEGTKRIRGDWVNGQWAPASGVDYDNPDDFVDIIDKQNNPTGIMSLDGAGDVNPDPKGDPHFIGEDTDGIELYKESNFFTLGVPASL